MAFFFRAAAALSVAALALASLPASGTTWKHGTTEIVTVTPTGSRPDGAVIEHSDVSKDGRYVMFETYAKNMTSPPTTCGPNPNCEAIYLRDTWKHKTQLVRVISAPYSSDSGEHTVWFPSLSPDGRYVAYSEWAGAGPALIESPGGTTAAWNVYVTDRVTGRTELVSKDNNGRPAVQNPVFNGNTVGFPVESGSFAPSMSDGGRYVVFSSDAFNLGGHQSSTHTYNVYRRDRLTGRTQLVSTDEHGKPMTQDSWSWGARSVSADGRYVTFETLLHKEGVPGVTLHTVRTVRLWDAKTGRSIELSKPLHGPHLGSDTAAVSADGSHVVYFADDVLVPEDTNGSTDAYEYDVAAGQNVLISRRSDGSQAPWPSRSDYALNIGWSATVSADGRFAAFDTRADLGPGRTKVKGSPLRTYVHDLRTGETVLASVWTHGKPIAGDSGCPYLSADGRSVTFLTNSVAPSALDVVVRRVR